MHFCVVFSLSFFFWFIFLWDQTNEISCELGMEVSNVNDVGQR